MYTLYLLTKKQFSKDYFTNRIFEISIYEDKNSFGRIWVNSEIQVNIFCVNLVYLSGVLFSLEYVDQPNMKWKFSKRRMIENNFIDVYDEFGGGSDLLWILKNVKHANSSYVSVYIYELKKIITEYKNSEAVRKIIHKIYRNLQRDRLINGDRCYSIIKPYIPELKRLGKEIYNPFNRFRINAKAILF